MGSIPRPWPSGGAGPRRPIYRTGRRSPDRQPCRLRRKPSWWRSVATRCSRWTTVSTPCRRRSRISPDHRFIAACSGTVSAGCRLPAVDGDKPVRKKFKPYPIGYFHIDLAEVRTEEGRLYLFVAIDRTSKFAFVELHEKATRRLAANFLRNLAAALPYKIHTVLTDNGTHFTDPAGDGWTPEDIKAMRAKGEQFLCHAFEFACADLDIQHRLTKPRHPWTNGQVERMNRTIKDATVKRFYYESHEQLTKHLGDFISA